jgi:hypothetical protein
MTGSETAVIVAHGGFRDKDKDAENWTFENKSVLSWEKNGVGICECKFECGNTGKSWIWMGSLSSDGTRVLYMRGRVKSSTSPARYVIISV